MLLVYLWDEEEHPPVVYHSKEEHFLNVEEVGVEDIGRTRLPVGVLGFSLSEES